MAEKITSSDLRRRLGQFVDRVAGAHEKFVITRNGRSIAAMVPIETLEYLDRMARGHLLEAFDAPRTSLTQSEADRIADEAKHASRSSD